VGKHDEQNTIIYDTNWNVILEQEMQLFVWFTVIIIRNFLHLLNAAEHINVVSPTDARSIPSAFPQRQTEQ